jgi:hypothetical protein
LEKFDGHNSTIEPFSYALFLIQLILPQII